MSREKLVKQLKDNILDQEEKQRNHWLDEIQKSLHQYGIHVPSNQIEVSSYFHGNHTFKYSGFKFIFRFGCSMEDGNNIYFKYKKPHWLFTDRLVEKTCVYSELKFLEIIKKYGHLNPLNCSEE